MIKLPIDNATDEDEFMMAVAEAGGEDYEDAGEQWIVDCLRQDAGRQSGLEAQGIEVKGSELTMVPPLQPMSFPMPRRFSAC